LRVDGGELTGGVIEVDMNTIEDKNHRSDNKLANHLKDPDFFDVKKFPFATIVITRIASINNAIKKITGNLTIKGIAHPVTFPAKVDINAGMISANCKLIIDRTKWDVRYKSGKFYDLMANQIISDSIELNFKIVAEK
jgi:polyisoprenoid-binding protein YceI